MKPSTALLLRAALAVAVGVIAVAWPNITVGAFVLLFAVHALLAAAMEGVRAFTSGSAGPVIGHLLLALLDVAAAVGALAWPGITALALVIWVAAWALVTGATEVAIAFRSSETAGQRTLLVLTGLVAVAFGVVLLIRPDIGALALAQVYGLFAIFTGITLATAGWTLRQAGNHLRTPLAA